MAGTMTKRGKDTWQLQVRAGTDISGKPIRYYKTFHGSKREANRELVKFYNDCMNGKVQKSSTMTIQELSNLYYNEYATKYLKSSSQRSFISIEKTWLIPYLGKSKINRITRIDIQKFVNLVSEKVSPKTVRNIYAGIRSVMKFGVEMGFIDDTPCKNISLPKKLHTEAKFYNAEEVKNILTALDRLTGEEFKYKVAIQLGLFGGLRKGEIVGLNWEDIDFQSNSIKIIRTRMIKPKDGIYEDTPKTSSSNRVVHLPNNLMLDLKRLKAYQSEQQLKSKYYLSSPAVFRNEIGGVLYPQVLQRWFLRFCNNNNIKYLGLHSLRHTHASMLANFGTDAMQVSSRLGHSNLSTTLDIYTHLFENKDKEVADKLAEKYFQNNK